MLIYPDRFTEEHVRDFKVALAFMRKHFRRGLVLADVARVIGWSKAYFNVRFTRWYGRSPKALLTELAIEEAKRLLATPMHVEEIARRCGFHHRSAFAHRFRQVTGLQP
jgi:AraC-like DNA-binding protein